MHYELERYFDNNDRGKVGDALSLPDEIILLCNTMNCYNLGVGGSDNQIPHRPIMYITPRMRR